MDDGRYYYQTVSDVNYHVIDLSPQYWANTPLLVGYVLGLLLINGIDCLVTPPPDVVSDDADAEDHHDVPRKKKKRSPKDEDVNSSWNILPLPRV